MRALVTGASGFIGRHLISELLRADATVIALGRSEEGRQVDRRVTTRRVDIRDSRALRDVVRDESPDVVFHLAGIRAGSPLEVYETNVLGTVGVLDAVTNALPRTRTIVVGSSAMYGPSDGTSPQNELSLLEPVTPYGVSKAAADLAARQYFLAGGYQILRARPFNIVGPGQRGDNVAAVCARQIVEAEQSGRAATIELGSLEAYRDFLDVRDVASALLAIAAHGNAGEAYNVCRGQALQVRALIHMLVVAAGIEIEIVERERVGSIDVPMQIGSFEKLHQTTGWSPQVELERSVRDILADWRGSYS